MAAPMSLRPELQWKVDLAIFEPGSRPSGEDVLTRSHDPRAKQHSRLIGTLYTCLVLLTLVYALLAGLKTVVDFDLGWQMATGRYLLAHHAIPRTELFSYTAHGSEWIYPVFSGLVFYLLHQMGGYAAISWFCALACVATAVVLIYKRSLSAVVLALLAVPVLASEIMPRASLFTILLFTCFARILVDHFEGRRSPLWLLPLLMVFWVNLHTGFVAGCVLAGAYLTVEALELPFHARRTAAIARCKGALPWLIAAVLVTVINPWGIRIFAAISRQQSVVRWQSASLEEWEPVQAASALQELGWRTPDSGRWWLLGLGIILAALCLWRRRIGPALVLLVAAFAFLRHQRMEGPCIILICLIGGSVLTNAAAHHRFPWHKASFAFALVSLLAALVAVRCFDLITNRTYLSSGDVTLFGTGPSWWLPDRATNFLLRNHPPANLFSSFNLGSYLVWRLGDQYPDFADGRYIPFGPRLIDQQRTLASLPLDSMEWTQAVAVYHINTVIFPLSRIFALGEFPLLADCESSRWTPVYMDVSAIIFQRRDAETISGKSSVDCHTQKLLSLQELPLKSSRQRAERYEQLANASAIYAQLGRLAEAGEAAERAEAIYSNDMTLHFVKAQVATNAGQPEEAEQELRKALAIKQTDAGWYNLGLLYTRERRFPEAIEALQHSARLSHQVSNRYLLIARIYLLQQQPQQALHVLGLVAENKIAGAGETPVAAEFRAELAEEQAAAFMQLQQAGKAIKLQLFAVQQTPANLRRKRVLVQYCQSAQITCPLP
jgi:tetratricopeptide (TPR) repeat protein